MRYFAKVVLAVLLLTNMIIKAPVAGAEAPGWLDVDKLPELQVTSSSRGGRLLLSDSPEMVKSDGILYQDKVSGNVRLFFYHVNSSDSSKRLEVILENNEPQVAHVTIHRYGLGGPGYNWMAVGKEAVTSYLAGSRVQQVSVPVQGDVSLSTAIGSSAVLPNMLINGIFDFVTDRPVTVKVMMMPVLADGSDFSRQAKVLPADEAHLRGTFDGANRRLAPNKAYDPSCDGVTALTLADNEVDRYLEGIDATDGSKVVNYGNYGVVYEIFLPTKDTGKIACYLAPLGGPYAGAIGVRYLHKDYEPVATPGDRIFFGSYGTPSPEYAFLGAFDGNKPLSLTFSPPGGSDLPVRLIILPQ